MGDSHVGLQARLMSQAMRKLAGIVSKQNCCIIFLNQIRLKVGVMYGSPEVTSGGNALKFYASQRLAIRRKGTLDVSGSDKIGILSEVKVVKSKVGPPFKIAFIKIMFGEGIDWAGDLLDMAVDKGIIDKAGAWFKYNGESIGQGAIAVANKIKTDEKFMKEIRDKVLATFETSQTNEED